MCRQQRVSSHATGMLYNAKQEGGGTTRLFKVLQTNSCRFACKLGSHHRD
jgi:hypothetical protein